MDGSPVWVLAGMGLPCGARTIPIDGPNPMEPRKWLNVSIVGQHIPQLYQDFEIRPLDVPDCDELGLCPRCLGFGTDTMPDLFWPASISDLERPCQDCGGTGRPFTRVTISIGSPSLIEASLTVLPHGFKPVLWKVPQRLGGCRYCGEPADNTFHN